MDAETAKKGVQTKTIVPSEGAIGWADTTFITPTAPQPAERLRVREPPARPEGQRRRRTARCCRVRASQPSIPLLSAEAKALYPFDDIDNYLNNTLTFNQGLPHEPDGDRATYDQVIAAWEAVKGS